MRREENIMDLDPYFPEEGARERRSGRSLTIFKSFILLALMAITLYGLLNRGLFGIERWTPVAAIIIGLLFVSLFVIDYFQDVPRIGWLLIGLLGLLVAIKGLSMTWSISQTETIREILRSSMYLATFALAVASLGTRRVIEQFVDGMVLIVGAVAGYGVLQKVNPVEYPSRTTDGVRVGSTLEYANTVAMMMGVGAVLALARMTQLKNPITRGLYAVAILVFGVILYFTFSRGGVVSLAFGLGVLFFVGGRRLQAFANLVLAGIPLAWLIQQTRSLDTLYDFTAEEAPRVAEGMAFRTDLVIAAVAAFLLQAIYATLAERYELTPGMHRALGAGVLVAIVAGGVTLGVLAFNQQGGVSGIRESLNQRVEKAENVGERLTTLNSKARLNYWTVAWEEWKEHPLKGTGAGTFMYTWLQERPGFDGVKQVHNVYLEQGTETGIFAFLALSAFAFVIGTYLSRAAWVAEGDAKVLLGGLAGAVALYLFSSALEWHWYIPPSTLFSLVLAGVALKYAAGVLHEDSEKAPSKGDG